MNTDIFVARTTDRKEWYRLQIDHYVKQIPSLQTPQGAFNIDIEPRFNPQENARLQEGVLPLAWHMQRFGTHNFRDSIILGLNYLLKLQLCNGAYPETEGESFSATAFITFALGKILDYGRSFLPETIKRDVSSAIQKSLPFLLVDRQVLYTNQHAAALLALKQARTMFPISDSILRRALLNVLSKRDSSGLFQENDGIDLGYSTLTYSLLSSFDGALDVYADFLQTLFCLLFPNGTHILPMSRTHGWIVLNALEAAARFYPASARLADQSIKAHEAGLCNATHLLSNRHILTTLYRLCEAYDNCDRRSAAGLSDASDASPMRSNYLKCFRSGQMIALFYLGRNHVGYSLYLGSNRILFGRSAKSVLIEKGRKFVITRSSKSARMIKTRRSFNFCNDSLVLTNTLAREPIFSVGPVLTKRDLDLSFCEANEHMFLPQNVYRSRLATLTRCHLPFRDNESP